MKELTQAQLTGKPNIDKYLLTGQTKEISKADAKIQQPTFEKQSLNKVTDWINSSMTNHPMFEKRLLKKATA